MLRRSIAGALVGAALMGNANAADVVRFGKAEGKAWILSAADVGVEKGFFARYGIDAEVVDFGGDARLQQAFAANAVDVGLGSGPGMAFAVKGSPAIGVACFGEAPRNVSLTVRDPAIRSVADMKGRRIAVSTVGSLTDWLAQQMSLQEGWGPNGIEIVPLGTYDSSSAALLTGQVDGVIFGVETGFILEEKHEARVLLTMDRYAPHFISAVVFAQRALVQQNPALVERVLKAFFATLAYMRTHKAETVAIMERVIGEDPTVASRVYDWNMPIATTDGRFDPAGVKVLEQSLVDMKILKQKPADDQLFTTQFVPVRP